MVEFSKVIWRVEKKSKKRKMTALAEVQRDGVAGGDREPAQPASRSPTVKRSKRSSLCRYALPQCQDLTSYPYLHQSCHLAILHQLPVEYVTGEMYLLLHYLTAIYDTGKWRRAMRPLWILYTSKRLIFILYLSISSRQLSDISKSESLRASSMKSTPSISSCAMFDPESLDLSAARAQLPVLINLER